MVKNWWSWAHLQSRTALILHCTDSPRRCKHSSENFSHIDVILSHICCRSVGCTSMMRLSFYHIPKSALLYWDLWRALKCSELTDMFEKPLRDDLSFVTSCVILLEAVIEDQQHTTSSIRVRPFDMYCLSGFRLQGKKFKQSNLVQTTMSHTFKVA